MALDCFQLPILPIVEDDEPAPAPAKKRRGDPAWPSLHERMCAQYGATCLPCGFVCFLGGWERGQILSKLESRNMCLAAGQPP